MRLPDPSPLPSTVGSLAIPYNLLERVRLAVRRLGGKIIGEDFAADITITLEFPILSFEAFEIELRELSAGRLKAEVIESKETVVPLLNQ